MDNILQMLLGQATLWLPKLGAATLILLIFFIIAKITKNAIVKGSQRLKLDNNLVSLMARMSSVSLILFGLVTALGTLGINVSALVAGLGLSSFALGFALKDTISNLLSGALILLYKPFKIGDIVKIAGYEGEIVFIDLRYTGLNSDGNKVLIPNAKIFTEPVTVFTPEDSTAPASEEEKN